MFYFNNGKRILDIILATLSIFILSPLILFTGFVIIIFDPGPVFFLQQRVGINGKLFTLFKFRSMPVSTDNVSSDQIKNIKIKWIGRIIRRTNIDELPQLMNIILGDMSIVGPRPSLPQQAVLISLRKENGAIKCKPGLTGLAQVNSYEGMPESDKANYDGEYYRSISALKDLQIIMKTFLYLLKPPPVY